MISKTQFTILLNEHLEEVFRKGQTSYFFQKEIIPDLIRLGLFEDIYEAKIAEEKLDIVYQSYLSFRYSIEQYRFDISNIKSRPYWQYKNIVTNTDPGYCISEFEGKVFLYNDIFWDKYYPPNQPGCNVYIKTITKQEMDKDNLKLSNGSDFTKVKIIWAFNPAKVDWKSYFNKFILEEFGLNK